MYLYSKLGRRLKVVALIDPAIERATAVLQKKCDSFVVSAYQDTRVFKTLEDFVKNMAPKDRPRAVIVGSPPMFRGSLQPGRDIEIQILKFFPGVAMFIEKPIATGPAHEIDDGFTIAKMISDSKTVCSVGYVWIFILRFFTKPSHSYMLRYLKAVQMMKQIIEENNLTVMTTIARYACAYQAIAKPDWWDKSKRSVHTSFSVKPQLKLKPIRSVLDPSLSKEPISATFRATSVVKLTFPPSLPTLLNGTKTPATSPNYP